MNKYCSCEKPLYTASGNCLKCDKDCHPKNYHIYNFKHKHEYEKRLANESKNKRQDLR